jgi:tetratricopeptide (TPR) repeat protein
LREVKDRLKKYNIVGITGISGIGKSELARKYVQKYGKNYDIIAFFDTTTDLIPQYISFAKEINQKICSDNGCYIKESPESVKQSLMEFLRYRKKWLVIFDNLRINENDKIVDFINWKNNGNIIICTQDSKYITNKIVAPYLSNEHTFTLIKTIMKDQPSEFIHKLVATVEGYPTSMIAHSAIYLANNNHMTIEQYMNYMKKENNKIKAHLKLVLSEMHTDVRNVLLKMAILNNQKISRNLLENLIDDNDKVARSIDDIIRYGLIEQISKDRDNQVFRMHDSVKEGLNSIEGAEKNKLHINSVLDRVNEVIPEIVTDRLAFFGKDKYLESNLEILLRNAEEYNADPVKVMAIRNKLLWLYLIGARQSHNAKKMVDWFRNNEKTILSKGLNDQDKAILASYFNFIGGYEHSIEGKSYNEVMEYLDRAEKIMLSVQGNDELKSYIFSTKAQIQIASGDIPGAIINLEKAEKARPKVLVTFLGSKLVEYIKSRIYLAQGEYQRALDILSFTIDKPNAVVTKDHTIKEDNAKIILLAPEYLTKSSLLNFLHRHDEAYEVVNKLYTSLQAIQKNKVSSALLVRTLTELARAKIGLKQAKEGLEYASEAVNILIKDQERNQNNIENSKDILLANALMVKGEALKESGDNIEAVKNYKLSKHIFENAYGFKNLGNFTYISDLFKQGAKAATGLSNTSDRQLWCSYFYKTHSNAFGVNDSRSQEIKEICEKD